MQEEINKLTKNILGRSGTVHSFEGLKIEVYADVDDKTIKLLTDKPIKFLGVSPESKGEGLLLYNVPRNNLDVYESLLIHILKSNRIFIMERSGIIGQVAKYYVFSDTTGLEYIMYYPGRITWVYKDDYRMFECDADMYMQIIRGMDTGLTSTQKLWKEKSIINYGDIFG